MQKSEKAIGFIEKKSVSDSVYQEAVRQFTEDGVVDLIALLGHYASVSMILNAFEVPLPDGAEPPFSV